MGRWPSLDRRPAAIGASATLEIVMSEPTPEGIRARLVEIDDELRDVPDNSFARKHELNKEGDAKRDELRAILQPELDAASGEWAERAGRKGTHSVAEDEKIAQAGLISPGEGGGGN